MLVSSTDYAPTPAEFAVDGLTGVGVRNSGWRAAVGDPQWISVDLQALCEVESLRLTFEATLDDAPYVDSSSGNPRLDTTGQEILSSCATDFVVETSRDQHTWTTAFRTDAGRGGVMEIPFRKPATARWVRMTVNKRSNTNPVGLNGLQVYGTCRTARPSVTGWTDWGTHHRTPPALRAGADGTVPLESGWDLTMDDWAGQGGAELSKPSVDTSGWLPATVPGTVLTSLVDRGHLPDPVAGMNNLHTPEALSRHSWWYRRAFELPKGLRTGIGRHVWLEFDGVNHEAEVWPNGYGEAALHGLTLAASVDGQESDRRTTRFGIRQFGYEYQVPLVFQTGSDSYAQTVDLTRQRARYVRVACHTRATDWGSSLWSLSVADSAAPDTDLALHRPATASTVDTDSNGAGNVTDGDPGTRWSSAFQDEQWVQVDLGPSLSFDRVVFTWEQAYAKTYTVQVSDDGDKWTDAKAVDNTAVPLPFHTSGSASLQNVDFAARTARYVRVFCHARASSWGSSMWGLSVVDSTAADTDLALRKKATASSVEQDSNGPSNAVDGNPNTRWASAYEDEQWIQVDLGSPVRFDRVAITWEQAYAKTYTIQVSDDGDKWTDVTSVDNSIDPLKISVNGVRVFCRGGNWGWDELLRRMPAERMDAAVRMHRDMNFTMIRNWAGCSNREEFSASCDEHGLLVWNDFPNAWGMDPPNHQLFLDAAQDTVRRYRVHPCVVVWCGANEGNPPGAVDDGMRKAVRAEAPDVLYQDNSAGGIVTGGGPYGWVEPERYYTPTTYGSGDFGFHTEIGMPVLPTAETMRRLVGDEPEWPVGGAWYLHDWSTRGNQAPQNSMAAVEERLGTAKDLDDFCRKAQFVNYENFRAMFEAWNAKLWDDATGLMLWMSHPTWYSTVWQTYDYDFDVNSAYYGARKANEALHVQADPRDGR